MTEENLQQNPLNITHIGNQWIVDIPEYLTVLEALALKNACDDVLGTANPGEKLVLNYQDTRFLDSSGVGALIHNLKACEGKGVSISLIGVNSTIMGVLAMTGLDKVFTIDSEVKDTTSTVEQSPQTHPSVISPIKRLIDVIGSIVGLGITAVLFIPIALAIKLDSPGPILFSQTRCGWLGKRFRLWKFRSMCTNAEAIKSQIANQASGAFFKNDQDPRITKVGSFLRKTSLDELPQFWNVLKGEMSLVGTRPPTPDEVEQYEIPQWQRLNVKPGMTGEWQVNGRSLVRNFEDVIKLDLRYQDHWSLKYDIQLIIKTISILFRKNSGAQ